MNPCRIHLVPYLNHILFFTLCKCLCVCGATTCQDSFFLFPSRIFCLSLSLSFSYDFERAHIYSYTVTCVWVSELVTRFFQLHSLTGWREQVEAQLAEEEEKVREMWRQAKRVKESRINSHLGKSQLVHYPYYCNQYLWMRNPAPNMQSRERVSEWGREKKCVRVK
jgi:hypothetical protein